MRTRLPKHPPCPSSHLHHSVLCSCTGHAASYAQSRERETAVCLNFIFLGFIYLFILCLCLCVGGICADEYRCLWRPEGVIRSPGAGFISPQELSETAQELNLGSVQEQESLLSRLSSLRFYVLVTALQQTSRGSYFHCRSGV